MVRKPYIIFFFEQLKTVQAIARALIVWSSPAAAGAPIRATPARGSASKARTEVQSRCRPSPHRGSTAWSPSLTSACVLWRTTTIGPSFSAQVNEQCSNISATKCKGRGFLRL